MHFKHTPRWACAALALAALTATLASGFGGEETTKAVDAPLAASGWEANFNLGLALTSGNADTFGLSIGFDAERKWKDWQLLLNGVYNYTEIENVRTGNALRLTQQLNRDLTERWYLGVANAFTYDEIAGIDYRDTIALVLGYRLWKSPAGEFSIEGGPSYTWEKQGGVVDNFFGLRIAQRFKYNFSEGVRFYEAVSYTPEVGDFGNYFLTAEAGITARIAGNFWWRLGILNIYNSEPAPGFQPNDLQIVSGLTYGVGDPDAAAASTKRRKRSDRPAPSAPGRPEGVWQTTAFLGFSLMKGNSDNLLVSGNIATGYTSKPHEFDFNIGGTYGETSGVKSLQNIVGAVQYNRSLSDVWYLGARADFLHNDISLIDYRVTPSIMLGAKVVNTERVSLRFEAGPAYTWEKVGGVEDNYFGVVARERFEIALSDSAKLWQSAGVLLDPGDIDNYVLTAQIGMDFWLTENVSVRVVATDIFDNQPAVGAVKNDFQLTSGIAISF